jgi:tetratricopeptide (TPR) repeat protein
MRPPHAGTAPSWRFGGYLFLRVFAFQYGVPPGAIGRHFEALVSLEAAAPYELQTATFINYLYPAYVRGQAYLLAHNGTGAAAEFQKLLDHRGAAVNFVTGALAHLQLGRAYAMAGDTAKAKSAYQDFFTLWKDADPDIPILKQAKAEYAKLQ